jgi:hypothetical protein
MVWEKESRMWRRWIGMAIRPVVLLVLAACAGPVTTPGAVPLSATGTAVIRGGPAEEVFFLGRGAVTVTRIDDTNLVDGNDVPLYGTVEVYPGLHDVHFLYLYAALCATAVGDCAITLSRPGRLTLAVFPGHVYRVTGTYRKGSLVAWVIDETEAGRVVATNAGGDGDWAARQQGIGTAHQF